MKKFSASIQLLRLFLMMVPTIFSTNYVFGQEELDYNISPRAYGIGFDGTYLYYLDSERRALIRYDSLGNEEVFNIGVSGMKGVSFDKREGRLLVTAPRQILKLDPNNCGIVDRIPIPIDNLAGIASVDGLYYLLDSKDGRVNYFDKASKMIVGGFLSDRIEPRDLSYGKDSLWISDSSNGIIYRYNPINGKITGSIQAPANDIRGVLFSGSKIWIVDRSSKKIRAIPFVETETFLASGETNYKITYKLSYSFPSVSLSQAEVGIILPPSNEHQRIRNISSLDKDFKNGVLFKSRSINKKLNLDSPRGTQETEINFEVKLTNMTYFLDDRFLKKKSPIPSELDPFRYPLKERIHDSPEDTIQLFNKSFRIFGTQRIHESLLNYGFPVITGKKIIYTDGEKTAEVTDYLSSYFPGFGWIPYSPMSIPKDDNNRIFEYSDKEIVLFQSMNSEFLTSPIFFRSSPDEDWKNLSTRWTVSIRKIKN